MASKSPKKLVFISHIHEEKEVAIAFKDLVEASFLNMIDVFVSSDGESISMGDKWLNSISHALQQCSVEVVACSPVSIQRPWVHFEGGAGWVRGVPVIPLCHSGLQPAGLPVPLNMLNGAVASDAASVGLVLSVIAKALGSSVPRPDLTAYLSRVLTFEQQYTFWGKCNSALKLINSFHEDMLHHLKSGKAVTVPIDQRVVEQFEAYADFLRDNKIVDYRGRKCIIMGPYPKIECVIAPLSNLLTILSAPECTLR